MQAALARPNHFVNCYSLTWSLCRPTFTPRQITSTANGWMNPQAHPVARRNYFESVDQMIENFLSKGPTPSGRQKY